MPNRSLMILALVASAVDVQGLPRLPTCGRGLVDVDTAQGHSQLTRPWHLLLALERGGRSRTFDDWCCCMLRSLQKERHPRCYAHVTQTVPHCDPSDIMASGASGCVRSFARRTSSYPVKAHPSRAATWFPSFRIQSNARRATWAQERGHGQLAIFFIFALFKK
jgi:hypothetical protein